MTFPASPIADHTIVECPFCGAAESAAGDLPRGTVIVCRECGETWNAGERAPAADPRSRWAAANFGDAPFGQDGVIVAERRPIVSYTVSGDSAWSAKIEGASRRAEPQRASHFPVIMGGVAAVAFLAAFFGVRDAAVQALPDLAGLYAAIGLPVNLSALRFEAVTAERATSEESSGVVVRAVIRNVGASEVRVPQLAAVLRTGARTPSGIFGFDPPQASLAPGATIPVTFALAATSPAAVDVVLRFRRPGEGLTTLDSAELAALQ